MNKMKNAVLTGAYFLIALNLLTLGSLALLEGEERPVSSLVLKSRMCLQKDAGKTVTLTVAGTGGSEVMSEEEYICGVVASQMPPEYDDEAIKAQAVVCCTLLRYRRLHGVPDEEQSFLTKDQMKEKWGRDYARYYLRLASLVHSVYGEYIAYDGEPILAAYHEMSCGMTEYGENIWSGEYPYLVPVNSRDDICAEDYRSTVRLPEERFEEICREKLGIVPDREAKDWLGESVRSDSGYVLSCNICDVRIPGQKMRNVFGLRSACFTLKYEDKGFVFDVKGSGHGAGMSMFGANQMALGGKSYREILAHYYTGTRIETD